MTQKELDLLRDLYEWFCDHVDGAPDAGPVAHAANRFSLELEQLYPWLDDCPVCGHAAHSTRFGNTCREWRGHTVGYLRECGCTGKEDDR